MRLHYTAALALVGWYLMVPGKSGVRGPLNEWITLFSFDSAVACYRAHSTMMQALEQSNPRPLATPTLPPGYPPLPPGWQVVPPGPAKTLQALLDAQCIATDDPRLKEK